MKWYKHDATAHGDAKLERVMIKYGMEGYGLYWYCLELIAQTVEPHNLSFELEHDAEIIAHRTGIHFERVQEMMTYMVDLGLFENKDGAITCMKLAKRLDQSMTSNPKMREIIKKIRDNHDGVMTNPDAVMQDKTRLDENRVDKKTSTASATPCVEFDDLKVVYPKRSGDQRWASAKKACNARLKEGVSWDEILDGAIRYANFCNKTDITGTQFVKQAATFCGPEKHFQMSWEPPASKPQRKQDRNVAAAQEFLDESK